MYQLVHFAKGTAWSFDKNGNKCSVDNALIYVPKDCEHVPCDCDTPSPCPLEEDPTPVVPGP